MQSITLPDAIEQIFDALMETLEDGRDSGSLPNVNSLVLGDRARPRPDLPSIWVFASPALNSHTSHGLAETWEMPVHLVTLVSDDEPGTGYRTASDLAARARRIVVANRRLGLSFVIDVTSLRFEPGHQQVIDHLTIHAAAATVAVKFHVFEREEGS